MPIPLRMLKYSQSWRMGCYVLTLVEQNKCGWKFASALGLSTILSTGQLLHHCSFNDRTLQGKVQDIWTKELDSRGWTAVEGLASQACQPTAALLPGPSPISAPPAHNKFTHMHTVLWPGTNRWAFSGTVNSHTGTFQFWSNLFFFWCYLFLPYTISLR